MRDTDGAGQPAGRAGRPDRGGWGGHPERGRAVHRVRHPGLPRADRPGPGRAADDVPDVHRKCRRPAAVLGAQSPRLAGHRGGRPEQRPPGRGRTGAPRPARRDHHAERGRPASGRGRAAGDRAARQPEPGALPGLRPAHRADRTRPAAARGQPRLGCAARPAQPGRRRDAVRRGRGPLPGRGLHCLRRRAQAGCHLLRRERPPGPGGFVLPAGERRPGPGRPRLIADGDVRLPVRPARGPARRPGSHRQPGADPGRPGSAAHR